MAGWDGFFQAQVGASASLAGLVFVGVSLNLGKILESGHLPNRAQEALLVLLLNLVISSLFLIPDQSTLLLGAEVLGLGALAWLGVISLHFDSFRRMEAEFRRRATTSAVVSHVMSALICIGGAVMALHGEAGVYWLTAGLLLTYFVALANAWVLTVEINR